MNLQNSETHIYSIDRNPTGTMVKLIQQICKKTRITREEALSQFPNFISEPVRERYASKKKKKYAKLQLVERQLRTRS